MEDHRPFLILVVMFAVLFISAFTASAETIERCPDKAVVVERGDEYGEDVTERICSESSKDVKGDEFLVSEWYALTTAARDIDSGSLIINSVLFEVEMKKRQSGPPTTVEINYYCGNLNSYEGDIDWMHLESEMVFGDFQTFSYTIPENSRECNETRYIFVIPWNSIYVRTVNLTIDYSIIEPPTPGDLEITVFSLLGEYDKYDGSGGYNIFPVTGSVACFGGPCGNVSMALQYSYEEGGFRDIPVGSSSAPFNTIGNPWECSELSGSNYDMLCQKTWNVQITEDAYGEYRFRLNAGSDDPEVDGVSEDRELNIAVGDLFIDNVNFTDSSIFVGEPTTLYGKVVCKYHNCGKLNVYAMENDNTTIVNGIDFTINDPNPIKWTGSVNGSETVSWKIQGMVVGTYNDIHITVLPENGDIPMAKSDTVTLDVNPEPPGPYLTIADSGLNPLEIYVGNTSELSGELVCINDYCGNVTVSAKQGENNIPIEYVGSIHVDENPKTGECLSNMENGSICPVRFTITGDSDGMYSGIKMLAESDQAGVLPVEVQFPPLTVSLPPPPPSGKIVLTVVSPVGGSVFNRGDTVFLEAQVTEDGDPRAGEDVLVSFSKGLHEPIHLIEFDLGRYSGHITVPVDAQGLYTITYSVRDISEQSLINVDSDIFTVTLNTDNESYTTADDIKVSGIVIRDKEIVKSFVNIILCNNYEDREIISTQTTDTGEYSATFKNLYNFQDRSCQIVARAFDENENTGSNMKTVDIIQDINQTYVLEFIEPNDGDTVKEKDVVNVKVRVLSDSGPLRDALVFCTMPTGEEDTKVLNEIGEGIYSNSITVLVVPPGGKWKLTCDTTKKDGFFGGNSITLYVKPKYAINITYLGSSGVVNGTLLVGQDVQFRVAIKYINGTTFTGGDVFIRGDSGVTYMNKTHITGIYSGDFVYGGERSVYFEAYDGFGNSGVTELSILAMASPLGGMSIIPIISGIFLLLAIPVVSKLSRRQSPEKKAGKRLKELKKRQRIIEKSKEAAEVEYYQRKIGEKEFKIMLDDYEEMLIPIKEEIKELEAELRKPGKERP
jgi:hypothetical protein